MSTDKLSFKDKLSIFFTWALVVFLIALIVGFIIFQIVIFFKYGNKPADEVPSWAHWLMLRNCGRD